MKRYFSIGALILCLIAVLCACGSKSGEKNLKDGTYQVAVTLTGGSGKASVESPATVVVENGKATATIIWSSPYYDFMNVGGKKYEPVSMDGNSVFEIPVSDGENTVQADTIAMSQPHLIDYTLTFDLSKLYE